jgi:hypothetical protein
MAKPIAPLRQHVDARYLFNYDLPFTIAAKIENRKL